jgi:nucleotide-binding universal stress UspA family protein
MGTAGQLRLAPISLKNILFAMDFSPGSLRAYPFAAGIAYRYGGKVLVAHVLPPEESTSLPQAERAYLGKLLQTAAEASLHDPKGRLPDIPHEVFFDHGDICARLLATADRCKIDLIVIGTHGWRGIRKLLKGSTAEEVACLATRPVLTVGPRVSGRLDFRHILYAPDFMAAGVGALPYALSVAQTYGADLLVLHVDDGNSEQSAAEAVSKSSKSLRQYSSEYSDHRLADRIDFKVDFGPRADLILEHAKNRQVDLIVLGLRHRGRLKARIAAHIPGSTTYEVISQAPCPVLTIPLAK